MAKKKIKKVSVNAMDAIMENIENTVSVDWNGTEIVITKTLSLMDMLSFVDGVVKSCFDDANNSYIPEAMDFAIRCNILERYANFSLPKNLEAKYDIVMQSGAVEMVVERINNAQFNQIVRSIESKVKNIADMNIHMLYRQFNEVLNSFNAMQEKLGSLFAGLDPGDINKLVGAISERGMDEEKLVKAYMEQKSAQAE